MHNEQGIELNAFMGSPIDTAQTALSDSTLGDTTRQNGQRNVMFWRLDAQENVRGAFEARR